MFLLTALVGVINAGWHRFTIGFPGLLPWILLLVLNVTLGWMALTHVLPGTFGQAQGEQQGHHRVPFFGSATLKTPPAWSPENAQAYPFRQWASDTIMWSMATDMDIQRQDLQLPCSCKEVHVRLFEHC